MNIVLIPWINTMCRWICLGICLSIDKKEIHS